jgi:hypothetical protein
MPAATLLLAAALAAPVQAQPSLARPIAGCKVAALNQQARVVPESEFYRTMTEVAAYWQGQLERAEPDPAKREAVLAGAKAALEADLSTVSHTDGMFRVGAVLNACAEQRKKMEGARP